MIKIYHQKNKDYWFGAAINKNQVLSTYFSKDSPNLNRLVKQLSKNVQFQILEKPNQLLKDIINELIKIFNGQKSNIKRFNLDFSNLSTYSKKVLDITNLVPVGYVSTYKKIAEVAGGSARSVGNVEAKNPLPLLIPCHRIVCSDFRVGGYGFGEKMKIKILRKEDRGYEENDEIMANNKKLILYPVKKIK